MSHESQSRRPLGSEPARHADTSADTSVPVLPAPGSQAQVSEVEGLEGEIDRLVYVLYGLTKEEIGIVEGKA